MDPFTKKNQLTNDADTDNLNKFIRCPECGEQIQMVPNLSDMISAIESHISIHRESSKSDLDVSRVRAPGIREDLTEQAIIQASILRETPKDTAWIKLE